MTAWRGLLAIALFAPSLAFAQSQPQADPEAASGFAPKPLVRAERYMIVAANPLAAEAGAAMLAMGGSAVDAAIAAQMVLNLVEPQSSGVGGGAFAIHWDAAEARLSSWDGRETAPAAATPELFFGADSEPLDFWDAVNSGRSIGAPGVARLVAAMHEAHGALPWPRLFEPAIRLADEGFAVSPRLAALIDESAERLRADPAAAELFFDAGGAPLTEGATLRNPDFAATLRLIAEGGADAFYTGAIAEQIVAAVGRKPRPGALSLDDLAAYRAIQREPVCMLYRARFRVCGMGPPSSGAVGVGQILGLLDHFPPAAERGAQAAHLFLEASKLAYADRAAYLADADVVSVPVAGLLDPTYLTLRAQLIDRLNASVGAAEEGNPPWREGRLDYAPDTAPGAPGTTHLTVIDARGDMISMTSSIETAFGSGRMAAGFLLNNQLTDFAFRPEVDGKPVANAVAPGKRPRSSMAPTIVFDMAGGEARLMMGLGSPGGSRIIEYVALALLAQLDGGLDPAAAAALPHLSQRNRDSAQVETRADADALAVELKAYGHAVDRGDMTSGLHIIAVRPDGAILGGADPRREGMAVGE